MRGEAEMTSNSTGDSARPQSMVSYSHYSQMPQGSPSDANAPWSQLESNTSAMFGATVKEEPVEDSRNDSGLSASMSPVSDKSDNHPSTSSPPNGFNPDDESIRVPKINSHGKIKTFSCKQCDFVALTKLDYWEHAHVHIKEEKLLKCPRCPFVTEYKHHLEYHLMNHSGTKPFKCEHCDYSCVNKSMLNSHLKSHSKVYQYRCADCNYETKYCHSLKLHLRKYMHKPAMVLNLDGTPNPLPIIDVYGTRRGPKVKKLSSSSAAANTMPLPNSVPLVETSPAPAQIQQMQQLPQMPINPLMNPLLNQNNMLPIPPPWLTAFPAGLPPSEFMFNLQHFQNLLRDQLEHLNTLNRNQNPSEEPDEPPQDGALDLTNKSNNTSENGDDMEESMTTAFDNVEVVENRPAESHQDLEASENRSEAGESSASGKFDFPCQYCGISFGDEVLFRIHIGYHGFSDPFTCNMCGEKCGNKVNFYLHIARVAH